MFPKGPRFPPEKPSEVPGPGHYKIPEESRLDAYKKGAFLEKAERFAKEKPETFGGPGPHNPESQNSDARPAYSKTQSSSHGLLYLQQQIEALKMQNAKLLTEHEQAMRKYEEKFTHNESTIKSLVKDNVSLQSQISGQQKEHRSATQRETALRTALEKAESNAKGDNDWAHKVAALQRKLQDFEKMHNDDKRRHQGEVDRLRNELDLSRRAHTAQCERATALRKQQDLSESKMKDLKKAIIADQTEIKELRSKIQAANQAKSQLASRHEDIEQLKKSWQQIERKHKAEIVSKDLRIAEQEKSLALECKRKEGLEQQVETLKFKMQAELKETQACISSLQQKLHATERLAEEANTAGSEAQQHQNALQLLMARTAEAYGQLAASSVSLDVHRQSELACASLRLRNIRLERRLADRDALIEQLTDYCRQASETTAFQASFTRDLEEDYNTILTRHATPGDGICPEDSSLVFHWLDSREHIIHEHDARMKADLDLNQDICTLYRAQLDGLLVAYAVANYETVVQSSVTDYLDNSRTSLQNEIEALKMVKDTAETELSKMTIRISEGQTREELLAQRLTLQQNECVAFEDNLRQERESALRLNRANHLGKKREEALKLEIERLSEDLADATRYKEAHADLLSEILSHTNPQQKIFYVDRIRQELAETKHQLLRSTLDREELTACNAALQHEVASYKSITVPIALKPQGTRVRIERVPLAPRSINGMLQAPSLETTTSREDSRMTLEEIM
ncbi:hypothetical protein BU17DRAFT_68456 [Hysterangium stoloniferum]|nr:hypothetical protein BU17DRAFT_68456 [Hysterangium stoloniferum]